MDNNENNDVEQECVFCKQCKKITLNNIYLIKKEESKNRGKYFYSCTNCKSFNGFHNYSGTTNTNEIPTKPEEKKITLENLYSLLEEIKDGQTKLFYAIHDIKTKLRPIEY